LTSGIHCWLTRVPATGPGDQRRAALWLPGLRPADGPA